MTERADSLSGEFDTADREHPCGMPVLRIELEGRNYYPSLEEVRALSFRQYVTWPNGKAAFPKADPRDPYPYTRAHHFLERVRAAA